LKAAPDKKSDGIVAFYIKYYLMISAYGFTSDPVYVIADGFMLDNEIDTYTVPGLNVSTGLEGVGHIVFCKTRGCNLKFYEWYV
jgi:hypothetical protein